MKMHHNLLFSIFFLLIIKGGDSMDTGAEVKDNNSNEATIVNNVSEAIKNTDTNKSKEERIVKPRNFFLYLFLKRTFDVIASLTFLILFGWFILILMFIKFCEDGHNPIYTSKRVGKNGKIIKFHKIRTMKPNAEQLKQELIDKGLNEADGPVFKMKDDPRITKIGKFYRKFSLDELPQIWDIFVGRISVVGPRSPIYEETLEYDSYTKHRLDVKGGLLCLWQIQKNRHQLNFEDWVELDIKYVETRSLWLDFKIIVKGAWMVLFDHSGE